MKYATAFLHWLGERNATLTSCRQADIDAWWAENSEHGRTCSRAFLNWAMGRQSVELVGMVQVPGAADLAITAGRR